MTDTPRPTAESPATEAGRALLIIEPGLFTRILAIEAEAAALSDSAHAIEALPFLDMNTDDGGGGRMVALDAVLALLAQPTLPGEPFEKVEVELGGALAWARDRLRDLRYALTDISKIDPDDIDGGKVAIQLATAALAQPTQDAEPSPCDGFGGEAFSEHLRRCSAKQHHAL